MKRPSRLKHFGRYYAIKWVPAIEEGGDECDGLTQFNPPQVLIKDGLPPQYEAEVLTHEQLHVLLRSSGLVDEELEEKLVTFLGGAITGSMTDNPALWRYIIRKATEKQKHD